MSYAVVVERLGAGYRRWGRMIPVLRDVSFTACAGDVTALLGPNGAGKTTLLRVLLGVHRPWKGSVLLGGLAPPLRRRRHGTAFLPAAVSVPAGWTLGAFLREGAALSGLSGRAVDRDVADVLAWTGLADRASERMDRLSLGTARRAALAFALTGRPEVLLLDEPLSGLDPPSRIAVRKILHDVSVRGSVVLMSSHDLGDVERMASHIVVLGGGMVAADFTWDAGAGESLEDRIAW